MATTDPWDFSSLVTTSTTTDASGGMDSLTAPERENPVADASCVAGAGAEGSDLALPVEIKSGASHPVVCNSFAAGSAILTCQDGTVYVSSPCDETIVIVFWVTLAICALIVIGFVRYMFCNGKSSNLKIRPAGGSVSIEVQTDNPVFAYEQLQCDPVDMSIVLLIDSSASVGPEHFELTKRYICGFLDQLKTGDVQVGVVRFETRSEMVCSLCSAQVAQEAVESMEYVAGETLLAPALKLAQEMLTIDAEEARRDIVGWQDTRQRMVLVVTDGNPNDLRECHRECDTLKRQARTVCFVTIGPKEVAETASKLASVARPDSQFAPARTVIPIQSFEKLNAHLESYITLTLSNLIRVHTAIGRLKCLFDIERYGKMLTSAQMDLLDGQELRAPEFVNLENIPLWAADRARVNKQETLPSRGSIIPSALPMAHLIMPVEATTMQDCEIQTEVEYPHFCAEVGSGPPQPADLVFLVDSSCSVNLNTFNQMKRICTDLVHELEMPGSRCGLVRFETKADVLLPPLGSGSRGLEPKKGRVLRAIQEMEYVVGETKLAHALSTAAFVLRREDQSIEENNNDRIILCMTDADQTNVTDQVRNEAAAIRAQGITLMFAVINNEVENSRASNQRANSIVPMPTCTSPTTSLLECFAELSGNPRYVILLEQTQLDEGTQAIKPVLFGRATVITRAKVRGLTLGRDESEWYREKQPRDIATDATEIVGDIDTFPGFEVLLPNSKIVPRLRDDDDDGDDDATVVDRPSQDFGRSAVVSQHNLTSILDDLRAFNQAGRSLWPVSTVDSNSIPASSARDPLQPSLTGLPFTWRQSIEEAKADAGQKVDNLAREVENAKNLITTETTGPPEPSTVGLSIVPSDPGPFQASVDEKV